MKLKFKKDGILEFDDNGNLPPGIYEITIEEIEKHYSFSPKRKELIKGLKEMLKALKDIGCKKFYLDGSFVTNKLEPGDFDACWETHPDIEWDKLEKKYPELKIFDPPRLEQKTRYFGEAFISNFAAEFYKGNKILYLDFFQLDKIRRPKGILLIKL